MSLTIAVLSTAFLCGSGIVLLRVCQIRADLENPLPEYVVIPKDHYEHLQREAKREMIIVQPQLPPPPRYSEKTPLFSDDDTISI
jgi:hypothetical protein